MSSFDATYFHLWLLLQIWNVWPQVSNWGILFLSVFLSHLSIRFYLVLCRSYVYVFFFQWVGMLPPSRFFLLFLGSPKVLSSRSSVILKVPCLHVAPAPERCVLVVKRLYPLRIIEVQSDVIRWPLTQVHFYTYSGKCKYSLDSFVFVHF